MNGGMGSSHPSLFPMLRLWAVVLFCLFTYIHASATQGTEFAEKHARALSFADRHGPAFLKDRTAEGVLEARSHPSAHAKKSSSQTRQAAC